MKYRFRDKKGRFKKPLEMDIILRYGRLYTILSNKIQVELLKARDKAYEA